MLASLRLILGGTLFLAVVATTLCGLLFAGLTRGPHWELVEGDLPGRSPFTAVRWSGDTPEVEVGGTFYELVSVDGVESRELVEFCQYTYVGLWQKRFSEDLVEVLARFGRPAFFMVDLELRELDGGEIVTRGHAKMTHGNRQQVWRANHGQLLPRLQWETDLLIAGGATGYSVFDDYEKLSPFTAVRWRENAPEVELPPNPTDASSPSSRQSSSHTAPAQFCTNSGAGKSKSRMERLSMTKPRSTTVSPAWRSSMRTA